MDHLKFAVSISGYQGTPITLLCIIEEDTDILLVGSSRPFMKTPPEGFAMVTNQTGIDCDFAFTEDHLRQAIQSYFSAQAIGRIDIADTLARCKPDHAIEKDTVDERGQNYRIDNTIDNGQVAILAAIAFADNHRMYSGAIDMMDTLTASLQEMNGSTDDPLHGIITI